MKLCTNFSSSSTLDDDGSGADKVFDGFEAFIGVSFIEVDQDARQRQNVCFASAAMAHDAGEHISRSLVDVAPFKITLQRLGKVLVECVMQILRAAAVLGFWHAAEVQQP